MQFRWSWKKDYIVVSGIRDWWYYFHELISVCSKHCNLGFRFGRVWFNFIDNFSSWTWSPCLPKLRKYLGRRWTLSNCSFKECALIRIGTICILLNLWMNIPHWNLMTRKAGKKRLYTLKTSLQFLSIIFKVNSPTSLTFLIAFPFSNLWSDFCCAWNGIFVLVLWLLWKVSLKIGLLNSYDFL